jgi:death-on-curing protein
MITIEQVLRLHELSIERYGGSHGTRDRGMLESAVIRPYQTFGGQSLYPSGIEKAAAIVESLIINHPFVDGNKRPGFLDMFAVLEEEGVELTAGEDEAYTFTINISTGSISFDGIVEWLKNNTKPK